MCISLIKARHYSLNRNGNSAHFFLYVCNIKIIKESFALTLNGKTVRVRCVFSMSVVMNAKTLYWLRRKRTKKADEDQSNS